MSKFTVKSLNELDYYLHVHNSKCVYTGSIQSYRPQALEGHYGILQQCGTQKNWLQITKNQQMKPKVQIILRIAASIIWVKIKLSSLFCTCTYTTVIHFRTLYNLPRSRLKQTIYCNRKKRFFLRYGGHFDQVYFLFITIVSTDTGCLILGMFHVSQA